MAIVWAVVILLGAAGKVVFTLSATLASHKGAYNTLFKVRCRVTEHMAKMPLGALSERSTGKHPAAFAGMHRNDIDVYALWKIHG